MLSMQMPGTVLQSPCNVTCIRGTFLNVQTEFKSFSIPHLFSDKGFNLRLSNEEVTKLWWRQYIYYIILSLIHTYQFLRHTSHLEIPIKCIPTLGNILESEAGVVHGLKLAGGAAFPQHFGRRHPLPQS